MALGTYTVREGGTRPKQLVAGLNSSGYPAPGATVVGPDAAYGARVDARGNLQVKVGGSGFEAVAASQTAQVLGTDGATGDFIARLVIIPATTSPGNVLLLDGSTSYTLFAGGATSVASLAPIVVELGMTSATGPFKVTTGANVSVIAIGTFS